MDHLEEPRKLVSQDLIVEEIPRNLSGDVFIAVGCFSQCH